MATLCLWASFSSSSHLHLSVYAFSTNTWTCSSLVVEPCCDSLRFVGILFHALWAWPGRKTTKENKLALEVFTIREFPGVSQCRHSTGLHRFCDSCLAWHVCGALLAYQSCVDMSPDSAWVSHGLTLQETRKRRREDDSSWREDRPLQ